MTGLTILIVILLPILGGALVPLLDFEVRRARESYVLAIVLAVFSLIAFAIPFAHTAVFWIAYGFGVFAILFQLYIFKTSFAGNGDAKSRFYGFPIARLGIYYLVAQLILSVVEMALAGLIPAWPVIIVNVLALAFALIGCITAETMRDEIVQQDQKLKKNVSTMRELQSMAASMVGQCGDEEMKSIVKKIADELRFSDPVSSEATVELEDEMRSQLADIQQAIVEGDKDGAKTLCQKLLNNLTERNRICSVNK